MTTEDRLVRMPEILKRTGLGRTTIYRRMAQGTFPRRVPLGDNSVAWYESELQAWIAAPTAWKAAA